MPYRIGIILGESSCFHRRVLRGIARYLKTCPELQALSVMGNILHTWEGISGVEADGYIGAYSEDKDALLQQHSRPFVNISNLREIPAHIPSIVNDDYQTGCLAAAHLLEKGLVRFYGAGRNFHLTELRLRGFAEQVRAVGGSYGYVELFGQLYYERHFAALREKVADLLRQALKPAGFFCTEDDVALRVIEICRWSGILVPEEIAVIGVNNDDVRVDLHPISLTSVALDEESLGWEAARLMHGLLRGEVPPGEPLKIPPRRVVPRLSTDLALVEDPLVARAINIIRTQLTEPADVARLAKTVHCSRSTLEKRFRAVLQRSPLQEINRQRLARAKELLIDGGLKVEAVAVACGFSSHSHFTEFFRKMEHLTPSEFQKRARESHLDSPVGPRSMAQAR